MNASQIFGLMGLLLTSAMAVYYFALQRRPATAEYPPNMKFGKMQNAALLLYSAVVFACLSVKGKLPDGFMSVLLYSSVLLYAPAFLRMSSRHEYVLVILALLAVPLAPFKLYLDWSSGGDANWPLIWWFAFIGLCGIAFLAYLWIRSAVRFHRRLHRDPPPAFH